MYDLRVLSLGAGVQSTALYLMALDGLIEPMPDVAIFADTQQEPPWVYENVWRLAEEGGDRIPIRVATAGDIGEGVRRAADPNPGVGCFASVPFWVRHHSRERGRGKRQCSREYKIEAIHQETRRILGLRKGERSRYQVEEWIGISADEASRAKPTRYPWVTTRWPFLESPPKRRRDLTEWLDVRGWGGVQKSACIFCPYRSMREWQRWRRECPELFEQACSWDDLIRTGGTLRGMHGGQYVTDRLKPLREAVDTANAQLDLNLFENECEGACGL